VVIALAEVLEEPAGVRAQAVYPVVDVYVPVGHAICANFEENTKLPTVAVVQVPTPKAPC
jgi:hypothetical protein